MLETYYITCLLHDLGTTDENTRCTHMSFEYYGAFKALNFLRESGAEKDQAEAVSEAIIRHADLGETGTLTSLGMLIQLSTVFGKLFSISLLQRGFHVSAVDRHTFGILQKIPIRSGAQRWIPSHLAPGGGTHEAGYDTGGIHITQTARDVTVYRP